MWHFVWKHQKHLYTLYEILTCLRVKVTNVLPMQTFEACGKSKAVSVYTDIIGNNAQKFTINSVIINLQYFLASPHKLERLFRTGSRKLYSELLVLYFHSCVTQHFNTRTWNTVQLYNNTLRKYSWPTPSIDVQFSHHPFFLSVSLKIDKNNSVKTECNDRISIGLRKGRFRIPLVFCTMK